jgi:uncharacterized protein (TIGR02145 family)/uncharacterized repeat protein (TIGR02543 family)
MEICVMCKRTSRLLIAASILMPLFLSCSDSNNPFTAANATISIVLVNSSGQRSTTIIADSVDKIVTIGVNAYLPKFIDSVYVVIAKSITDTDTVFTFGKSTIWTDTQWREITFQSAGARTVSAVALIQGAPPYSLTAGITISAKPVQTYTVAYNGNANTGGTVPIDGNTYQQGAGVTVKANTGALVRTRYTFAGWNTAADGSGTSYSGGETIIIGSSNVTLFAKWTQNPTFTATYLGNGNTGGTVPTDANAYEQGETVTVKTNSGNLARTGYTFTGWNTAADGSGTSYAGTATFTMGTANVTLYAKWTQNPTYSVTYIGNGSTGGSVPADANAYLQGDTVTVKANAGNLARTGYTFAGWNTAADGSGTSYAGAARFAMGTANVTLYAKWTQNPTYSITYIGNGSTGGSVPVDANAYLQGDTVTVKTNTGNLSKTGYTLAGWNTVADGSGTSYTAAAKFSMGTVNVTLFAKWTINIYTIKFNSNSGNTIDSQNITYNTTATPPSPPSNSGFVFAGWYSDQALTTLFNFTTPITSAMTLYAKWTAVYTVIYLPNLNTSGTVPVDTNKYTNGATVTVLDNTGSLTKTGYSFSGWNTNSSGTGTDRTPGSTFTMGSGNVTLHAKWAVNKYTVKFNSRGGSAVDSQRVDYATPAITPTPPTKTSYVFAGWYSDSALDTTFQFSTPILANKTMYAKWEIRDADGNLYSEVKIGNQVWMVENLKTTKFNDGTGIPWVTDNAAWGNLTTPGYCWYDDSIIYKTPYGALYNWYSVNSGKLAPAGWHVSTNTEWDTLITFLGGSSAASGKLKEAGFTHWHNPNTGATNSSGFTGLPGSTRDYSGTFNGAIGDWGMWWTSTEDANISTDARYNSLGATYTSVDSYHISKGEGNSIRCIRNY